MSNIIDIKEKIDRLNLEERRNGQGRRRINKNSQQAVNLVAKLTELFSRDEIDGIAFVAYSQTGSKYGVYGTALLTPTNTVGLLSRLINRINNEIDS